MHDERPRRRMAAALPEARLIVILRDPLSRAYSHYWLNRAKGIERLGFAEAIAAEPERLASTRTSSRDDGMRMRALDGTSNSSSRWTHVRGMRPCSPPAATNHRRTLPGRMYRSAMGPT